MLRHRTCRLHGYVNLGPQSIGEFIFRDDEPQPGVEEEQPDPLKGTLLHISSSMVKTAVIP